MGSLEYANFSHDAQNRLTGWTWSKTSGETGSAAYTYDDSGARVTRSATRTGLSPESVTTVDPEYEVDHNRQRTRTHLFVAGARVATLERQAPAPASGSATPVLRELHYHADRLGTPRLITDGMGAVVQRTFPKPFGELWKVVDGAGNDVSPSSRASQHLFTGQHADVESDLHYFGARTYDPLMGRFLEVDPELVGSSEGITFGRIAGAPQNLDGYGYALNNPIANTDPSGRWVETGLDLFSLSLSLQQYHDDPGFLNGLGVVADAAAVVFPGVPGGVGIARQVLTRGDDVVDAARVGGSLLDGARAAEAAAARSGAASVRTGQAGEAAVRASVDIGPKSAVEIAGRSRVPDGLTDLVLSEVKNVKSLSYTEQIRDYARYADESGRRFDLYVRPGAGLSQPLRDARDAGLINILEIPY